MNAVLKPKVNAPGRVKYTCYQLPLIMSGQHDTYTVIPHGRDFPAQTVVNGTRRYCALEVVYNPANEHAAAVWRDDTVPGPSNGRRLVFSTLPAAVRRLAKERITQRLSE